MKQHILSIDTGTVRLDGFEVTQIKRYADWLTWKALPVAVRQSFAVVLLEGNYPGWRSDPSQPDLNGVDLIRQLRELGYTGPIIASSNVDQMNRRMIDAGATEVYNYQHASAQVHRLASADDADG